MTGTWPVIGHHRAVTLLQREIALEQLSHAYLFAGPPHIGKRTLAGTLAQALLCEGDNRPCGVCDSCRRVARHRHPDLLVLDLPAQAQMLGESPAQQQVLKIETVRQVQRGLSRRPLQADRKVIVVPEAHLMTTAAANAFLKTLEEPPPYVVLLLTAPEAGDLLPTMVSRCQIVPLYLLQTTEVEAALQQPPWELDPERATLLAHLSGGRLGWAIRACAEPALLEERKETIDRLQQVLAGDDLDRLEIAERLAKHADRGVETLAIWSTWWRDLLLCQCGVGNRLTNVDRKGEIARIAGAWNLANTRQALHSLQGTIAALEQNVNQRLAWEAFLLTLPRLDGTGNQPI